MEYVKMGNTGMDVSRLCMGCLSFGLLSGGVIRKYYTMRT